MPCQGYRLNVRDCKCRRGHWSRMTDTWPGDISEPDRPGGTSVDDFECKFECLARAGAVAVVCAIWSAALISSSSAGPVEQTVTVDSIHSIPRVTHRVAAIYPDSVRAMRITGIVLVQALVGG